MKKEIKYTFANEKEFITSFSIGSSERENQNIENEEKILNIIMYLLNKDCEIMHKSSDYSTLVYKQRDLLRLKYTNNARWGKIFMNLPKKYIDNPIFEDEKKKTIMNWKVNLFKYSIEDIIPVLNDICDEIDNNN